MPLSRCPQAFCHVGWEFPASCSSSKDPRRPSSSGAPRDRASGRGDDRESGWSWLPPPPPPVHPKTTESRERMVCNEAGEDLCRPHLSLSSVWIVVLNLFGLFFLLLPKLKKFHVITKADARGLAAAFLACRTFSEEAPKNTT